MIGGAGNWTTDPKIGGWPLCLMGQLLLKSGGSSPSNYGVYLSSEK